MRKSFFTKKGRTLYPETELQIQCCEYLTSKGLRFHHSPNEGKRSVFMQRLIKKMGVQAGYPDLEIFPPFGSPFYVELKAGSNTPTEEQEEWLRFFRKQGYEAWACWSYKAFVEAVNMSVNILIYKKMYTVRNRAGYYVIADDIYPPKIKKLILERWW